MKKLLVVLGVMMSSMFTMTAQIEQCDVVGRYLESYVWDVEKDTYVNTYSDWVDVFFTIRDDFYIVTIADKDPKKIWWNYDFEMSKKNDKKCDIYFTRDDRKVIFKYEDQSITFFDNWDNSLGRYTTATVIKKTNKVTGSEYKGNKQNQPTNNNKRPF